MFESLFELASDDYAIQMLERMFGDIVPFVQDGGSITGGTWLVDLIDVFNRAMLLIALVVGSYTAYAMLFETTADGRVFGNTADTKYTILRVLIGAIAFIPVSGGFTFAQVILIWLTVQGSALGDVAWRTIATNSLSSEQILGTTAPMSSTDFLIRRQFADAMFALTAGELCMLELNNIATNAADSGDPETPIERGDHNPGPITVFDNVMGVEIPVTTEMLRRERQLFYRDSEGSFGRADNLCGSVSWSETYNDTSESGSVSFAEKVGALLIEERFEATTSAIVDDIFPVATQIAADVSGGFRNDDDIIERFTEAVDTAVANYISAAGVVPSADFLALNEDLLDEMDDLGWAFALSWHRGITMAAVQTSASRAELEIISNPVQNAASYFQGLGAWWNNRSSGINRSMFSQLESNFGYLNQFSALPIELGTPSSTPITTAMNGGNADTSGIFNSVYQSVLGWFSAGGPSSVYVDPMADLASFGKVLVLTGGGFLAADVAAPLIGGLVGGSAGTGAGPLGTIGGAASGAAVGNAVIGPIGWILLVSGFFLLSILPAIPLVYFFSAVISWLALIAESMFAIPLAVLAYFAPASGNSSLIGPWNKMLLNLFGIMLRPFFTIIGFVVGLILMRVGLDFLYVLFAGFLPFISGGSGFWSAIIAVGLIFMYIIAALTLVLHTSSLITELGDAAMNWIGIGMSQLGKMGIGADVKASAVGSGAAGPVRSLGRTVGSGSQRFLRGRSEKRAERLNRPPKGST